jgi:hypothetical protein
LYLAIPPIFRRSGLSCLISVSSCSVIAYRFSKEFFPVQSEDSFIEVTFHYQNGQAEGFDIPVTPEAFQEQLQGLLEQPWLTLHLFDRTVLIRTAQVMKVEVKPPLAEIQGQGVFPDAQLVTALTHGAKSKG